MFFKARHAARTQEWPALPAGRAPLPLGMAPAAERRSVRRLGIRQVGAIIAISLVVASCSDHRSPTEPPVQSFVAGLVYQADGGTALSGVPITIAGLSTMTDASGRFRVEANVGTFVQIEVTPASGVPPSQAFGLKAYSGENRFNVPVVAGGMHWWGIVRDSSSGAPIAGALVSTPWGDQRTDQAGMFLQRIDTRSTVVFRVSAQGYADYSEILRGSLPWFFHVLLVPG